METRAGFATITYRMQLRCKHLDWIQETQQYYNKVLGFYYAIILKTPEQLKMNNQKLLRELEIQTTPSRDKKEPENPLPYVRVPLYFRRAAINAAIGLARGYWSKVQSWEEKRQKAEEEGKPFTATKPGAAKEFHASPVYYKGMYKEFTENEIMLKLWTGKSWAWIKCYYFGRELPKEGERQSPTLKIKGKQAMLHIPYVQRVEDARTVKERMESKERICSVVFPGSDVLAVCAVYNSDGKAEDSYFVRGGKELRHRRKMLLGKIRHNKAEMGNYFAGEPDNTRYWSKIRNQSEYYAHLTSSRIVEYCKKQQVKVIVLPDYRETFNPKEKKYLGWTQFDWIGRRIAGYLQYKAWRAGIVVTHVSPHYTANKCHQCGENIKKYNEGYVASKTFYGGKNYMCPNGHKGSAALNTAKNIGEKAIERSQGGKTRKTA